MSASLDEHINKKMLAKVMPQKYISIFRIDGVPILPPLMTQEKRRQMQKLKEKAVKVEQRLEESRRRKQKYNLEYPAVAEERDPDQAGGSKNHDSSSCSSSVSEHIEPINQHEEVEKSYLLLSDLLVQTESECQSFIGNQDISKINRQVAGEARNNNSETIEPRSSETNLMQRMQKLQKSETLIFDHRSNTLLTPLSEDEIQLFQQQQQQINLDHAEEKPLGRKIELFEVEEATNSNFQANERPKTSGNKSLKKIPSICIDPPTPITATRTFSDGINPQSSIDAINVNSDDKESKNVNKSLMEEHSSDESFNCTGSTTNLERDLKTHRKVTNITGKILKFENFSTSEPSGDTTNCSLIKPPQRSATSPSLKAITSEKTHTTPVSLDVSLGSQSQNGLVRSNSFTLDAPSKALIEHIRQQKSPCNDNYPTKRSNLFSITRDTVESKAKRVQKVELKSRSVPTRLQLKPSTTNITIPSNSHSYGNKIKRSPYEQKVNKPKIGRQLKKSVSGTSTIKQMKPRPSMPTIQSDKKPTESARERTTGSIHFNDIETEHRQKFLELLAHQKREQQRMQQLFEEQQQHLLEQLSAKMSSAHIGHKNVCDNAGGLVNNSPSANPEYVESLTLHSPTITANSSVASISMDRTTGACELSSLESSAYSSTMPTTSQSSNRCTPRRRLFSHDFSPSASLCSNSGVGAHSMTRSNGTPSGPTSSRYKAEKADTCEEARRRAAAVTKINAHVRGYLVRRLFQTEQIQRIVQTIKDTLIFVLNLHMETMYDPVEAKAPNNVKLKAQLLRQLTSAMHTLHLILFQTTIKERMEIISRDRKRIKTKILTMNMKRTPTFRT